jgi:hypothetical protein
MPAEILDLRNRLLEGYEPLPDLARALDKTPRAVIKWKRDGFPLVKMGADWYVHMDRAKAWLLAQTNDPQNAA